MVYYHTSTMSDTDIDSLQSKRNDDIISLQDAGYTLIHWTQDIQGEWHYLCLVYRKFTSEPHSDYELEPGEIP